MTHQTMGETISTIRKEKGMTQKDLAEQLGVTDKAVSKWERDVACPDISTIPKLAAVLGISVEELLNASSQTKKPPKQVTDIIDIILRAVPTAMGVAAIVTSLLGQLTVESGFAMLGIGMTCLGAYLLKK